MDNPFSVNALESKTTSELCSIVGNLPKTHNHVARGLTTSLQGQASPDRLVCRRCKMYEVGCIRVVVEGMNTTFDCAWCLYDKQKCVVDGYFLQGPGQRSLNVSGLNTTTPSARILTLRAEVFTNHNSVFSVGASEISAADRALWLQQLETYSVLTSFLGYWLKTIVRRQEAVPVPAKEEKELSPGSGSEYHPSPPPSSRRRSRRGNGVQSKPSTSKTSSHKKKEIKSVDDDLAPVFQEKRDPSGRTQARTSTSDRKVISRSPSFELLEVSPADPSKRSYNAKVAEKVKPPTSSKEEDRILVPFDPRSSFSRTSYSVGEEEDDDLKALAQLGSDVGFVDWEHIPVHLPQNRFDDDEIDELEPSPSPPPRSPLETRGYQHKVNSNEVGVPSGATPPAQQRLLTPPPSKLLNDKARQIAGGMPTLKYEDGVKNFLDRGASGLGLEVIGFNEKTNSEDENLGGGYGTVKSEITKKKVLVIATVPTSAAEVDAETGTGNGTEHETGTGTGVETGTATPSTSTTAASTTRDPTAPRVAFEMLPTDIIKYFNLSGGTKLYVTTSSEDSWWNSSYRMGLDNAQYELQVHESGPVLRSTTAPQSAGVAAQAGGSDGATVIEASVSADLSANTGNEQAGTEGSVKRDRKSNAKVEDSLDPNGSGENSGSGSGSSGTTETPQKKKSRSSAC